MEKQTITVESLIAADLHKVWDFWIAPEHIINWNFASEDWHCPKAENELKEDGKFKYTMEAKNGSSSFDFAGIYTNVIQDEQIDFITEDNRRVSVVFDHKDDKTRVTETFEVEKANDPELQKQGWQAILDNFKKYVEEN